MPLQVVPPQSGNQREEVSDQAARHHASAIWKSARYSGANGTKEMQQDHRAEDDPLKGSRGLTAIG